MSGLRSVERVIFATNPHDARCFVILQAEGPIVERLFRETPAYLAEQLRGVAPHTTRNVAVFEWSGKPKLISGSPDDENDPDLYDFKYGTIRDVEVNL